MELKTFRLDDYLDAGPGEIDYRESSIAFNDIVLAFRLRQTKSTEQAQGFALKLALCLRVANAPFQQPGHSSGSSSAARGNEPQDPSNSRDRNDFSTKSVLQRPLKGFVVDHTGQIHQGSRWRCQRHSISRAPHFPGQCICSMRRQPLDLGPQPMGSSQFDRLEFDAIQFPQPGCRTMRDQCLSSSP